MAKLRGDRGVWLILHVFLLLPALGRTCDLQSEKICVVNVTSGVRTNIDCLLASTDPSNTNNYVYYAWRIEAPSVSRVLLTVPKHHVPNIIEATDGDDRGDTYIFGANSFAKDRDYFLSSSNVVYMNITLECSASTQFTVIAEVVNIMGTINTTGDRLKDCTIPQHNAGENHWDTETSTINTTGDRLKDCTIPQHNAGENHWDTETKCEESTATFSSYTFGDSCYLYYAMGTDLDNAIKGCKETGGFHLVFIDSSEEQNFLARTSGYVNADCSHPNNCGYWIGIKKDGEEERVWMDGSAIVFDNFNMLPDPSDKCFELNSEEGYFWKARMCNQKPFGYICEREQGYHGSNLNDKGCAAFEGTLPVVTNSNDGILLKFSYYIKTFNGSDNSRTSMLWTGTYIISCNSSDFSISSQSDLQIKVSCNVSSDLWAVNIQASGAGLVKISDMQLLISGTTTPLTIRPVPSSTTLVSTISPQTSPSQRIPAGSLGTALFSSSPLPTSPSSSSSMSTMTRSSTTRLSTPAIDIHSSSPPIITTVSSRSQDRSSVTSIGMTGSVGTALSSSSPSTMSTMTSSLTTRPSTPSLDTHSSSPPLMTTESSKSQARSSGIKKSVIPIVVVILIVLLIALTVGVFWYKRRGKSATSERNQQSNGNVQNPTYENDNGEHEYAEFMNSEKSSTKGPIHISSSEDAQQHVYSDLPASASKNTNSAIYNEVGEQDYNVLFGGKEIGDYHEYNLPDSDHGRSNVKEPTNEDSYQELSEDGKRCSPKGTEIHALPRMDGKAIESHAKVGDLNRTGDHAYQDLRKDDGGYTSLHNSLGLPQKPMTKVTAGELENSYQTLHPDGPEYFTLEPDETKPSPNPDNLQNSTYQPLRQEPEYAILESEQSDNPAKPEDNTYQSLLKDANNHADSDTEHRKDNTPKQGQSDPYDVLQRGQKTKQLSLDGYGSLGPTAKEEEEHDYESPEGKPPATTDYEDPIQDNSIADGPYDSLQRKTMSEPPRASPSLANQAVDGGDDDYETPDRSNDDPTDDYQTLDNPQEKSDSGNEEYSHLQRPMGAKLSHDPTGVSDKSNQYGKLNYGNSAAK